MYRADEGNSAPGPIVTQVSAIPLSIPLRSPAGFATRTVRNREYVLILLDTEDGLQGIGYTYVGTSGARGIALLTETVLAPVLIGQSAAGAERWWASMYQESLLLGRRGGALRAISALDIALWDLLGKRTGQPLYLLLGGVSDEVPAYASGGYYRVGDPIENVEAELSRYVANGFRDFKIKVGGAPLRVDVERVRAARETIGSGSRLALDANNAWRTPEEALSFIRAVEEFDLWWIEEPLSPDDFLGHAAIRSRSRVPIATGEIHATRWDFRDLLLAHSADILQPDVAVVGGVSEWMKIAHTASSFGVPVAPHWNANLHIHLAAAVDNCLPIEYFDLEEDIFNVEKILSDRLVAIDGIIQVPRRPGVGLSLDFDAVGRYRMA
jgi:L-alanine-DL-glutamate epimerase-like enolase superfamily enzyme